MMPPAAFRVKVERYRDRRTRPLPEIFAVKQTERFRKKRLFSSGLIAVDEMAAEAEVLG